MSGFSMLMVALISLGPLHNWSQTSSELRVIVLFDLTASLALGADDDRDTLSAFESGFLAHLKTSDRVRLGFIASRPSLLPTYSADAKALLQSGRDGFAAPPETRFGPSPIWDAVGAAVESLEPEAGRRAIVLHSNGLSTGGRLWRADVVLRAALAGIPIIVIAPPGFKADAQLVDATKRTGGSYLLGYAPHGRGDTKAALREAFAQALADSRRAAAVTR